MTTSIEMSGHQAIVPAKPPISSLSADTVGIVGSFLDPQSLAQMCLADHALYQILTNDSTAPALSRALITQIQSPGHFTTYREIKVWQKAHTSLGVLDVETRRPDINTLDLSDAGALDDEQFAQIIETCPNLETLIIDNGSRLTDASLRLVAEKCPNLVDLIC